MHDVQMWPNVAPATFLVACSSMGMPPPRASKQPGGNEKEQKAVGQFAALENQNQQNDSDQRGAAGGQIMRAEVAKKIFDFIEVHNLKGGGAGNYQALVAAIG